MNLKLKRILFTSLAGLSLGLASLSSNIVSANENSATPEVVNEPIIETRPTSISDEAMANRVREASSKLEGKKLSLCQNRHRVISAAMARVQDRSEKQFAIIDAIAQKVQAFYKDKNYNLENYTETVNELKNQYSKTRIAIKSLRQYRKFDCDEFDPKGKIKDFVDQARTSKQALKDYKTAVQALIRKVKSAGEREPQL